MPDSPEFLIYAACYRLGVLVVGGLSIWLGFRLFDNATSKKYTPDNAGNASAEGGGIKLSFTNLLPGTYFALFGTVMIGIMVWRGEPQLQKRKTTETKNAANEVIRVEQELVQRTDTNINLDGDPNAGLNREWNKLTPTSTLSEAAEPLSNIASSWQREGKRIGEAVAMARLAAFYTTDDVRKADYLALLSKLMLENGDKEKAIKAMQKAVQFSPKYRSELHEMRINMQSPKE